MTLPFSSDLSLTFPSAATFWDLRTSPQRVQRPSSPPGATYRYSAPTHLTSCSSSHGQFVISRASAMFSSLATPRTLPSRTTNVYLRHSRFSRSGSQDTRLQGRDPAAGGLRAANPPTIAPTATGQPRESPGVTTTQASSACAPCARKARDLRVIRFQGNAGHPSSSADWRPRLRALSTGGRIKRLQLWFP
jgi:hypothetical protein